MSYIADTFNHSQYDIKTNLQKISNLLTKEIPDGSFRLSYKYDLTTDKHQIEIYSHLLYYKNLKDGFFNITFSQNINWIDVISYIPQIKENIDTIQTTKKADELEYRNKQQRLANEYKQKLATTYGQPNVACNLLDDVMKNSDDLMINQSIQYQ